MAGKFTRYLKKWLENREAKKGGKFEGKNRSVK